MSPEVLGDCPLCIKRRPLRESHVLSDFLWKESGIKGPGKSFAVRSKSGDKGWDELHRQDGLKERMLCDDCEAQLGRYENYARTILFGPAGILKNRPRGHMHVEGLEYGKLKLFQMSLLWRMGASVHPYYGFVKLGKHQKKLREMLVHEDPGEPWRYGCMGVLLRVAKEPLLEMFTQPRRVHLHNHAGYLVVIAGMLWWFSVTSHRPPNSICARFLTGEGAWFLEQDDAARFQFLLNEVRDWEEANARAAKQAKAS